MTAHLDERRPDLKPYQPFGIPLLKLMLILMTVSLSATLIYELIK